MTRQFWSILLPIAAAVACVDTAGAQLRDDDNRAAAKTLAYWRFEGDGVKVPADGDFLMPIASRTAVNRMRGIEAIDSSGNGNTLYTWAANNTGHQYTSTVPAARIPQTGAPNAFSIVNFGPYPTSVTWSRESKPAGVDLETVTPLAWTLEASILQVAADHQGTFLVRDGTQVANGTVFVNGIEENDAASSGWAPLYFQARLVNDATHLTIQFTDIAGFTHRLIDPEPLAAGAWHNVAAVSDGQTLNLYRDSGAGFKLVNSTFLVATRSSNTRLCYHSAGSTTEGDKQWSWAIGRGRVGEMRGQPENHRERWFGYIDEVRITSGALKPSEFLFSPKPAQ